MLTAKKVLNLEFSEDRGGADQPENPCSIAIIRVGDLAGEAPELNETGYKFEDEDLNLLLKGLYNLDPFSGPEEPLDLEIELYQMEPNIIEFQRFRTG